MKALTIWQPFASLIAAGVKQYETRSWSTGYRGKLAIHAAKRWTYEEAALTKKLVADHPEIRNRLQSTDKRLNLGKVLCVARLVDVVRVTPDFIAGLSELEREVGFFAPGRFAWKLEVVQVFEEPIPARGRLGLWEWSGP